MCPTVKAPGPTNQKSVPGPPQRAEVLPPGSPRAIAPVAWITTPPGAGTVATGWLLGAGEGVALACGAACAAGTPVTHVVPGWVRLASGVPVVPSLLTTARPDPGAGSAISATWDSGAPARPGAGQARTTVLTGALCGCDCGALAASVTVCFQTASPAAAAMATTSTPSEMARFANTLLTSQLLPGRRPLRGPGQRAGRSRPIVCAGVPAAAAAAAGRAVARRRPPGHRGRPRVPVAAGLARAAQARPA